MLVCLNGHNSSTFASFINVHTAVIFIGKHNLKLRGIILPYLNTNVDKNYSFILFSVHLLVKAKGTLV